jgi:hypothetical protein
MIWRLEEESKELSELWLALDHQHSSQPIMRKQSTSFKNKKLGHAKKPELVTEVPYHELLMDSFRAFCTYRFYNSHTKAMALRKEELQ